MLLADAKGRIIEANVAATQVYGYTLDEFRNMTANDLRALEGQAAFARDWESYNTPSGKLVETLGGYQHAAAAITLVYLAGLGIAYLGRETLGQPLQD